MRRVPIFICSRPGACGACPLTPILFINPVYTDRFFLAELEGKAVIRSSYGSFGKYSPACLGTLDVYTAYYA